MGEIRIEVSRNATASVREAIAAGPVHHTELMFKSVTAAAAFLLASTIIQDCGGVAGTLVYMRSIQQAVPQGGSASIELPDGTKAQLNGLNETQMQDLVDVMVDRLS